MTPMHRYVQWKIPDGAPFDPWMRVHWRAGATIEGVCPESMTVVATVEDWEAWTKMEFPETGEYVVSGALVPLEIDREIGRGVYVEPNVWMIHRLDLPAGIGVTDSLLS